MHFQNSSTFIVLLDIHFWKLWRRVIKTRLTFAFLKSFNILPLHLSIYTNSTNSLYTAAIINYGLSQSLPLYFFAIKVFLKPWCAFDWLKLVQIELFGTRKEEKGAYKIFARWKNRLKSFLCNNTKMEVFWYCPMLLLKLHRQLIRSNPWRKKPSKTSFP